MRRRDFVRLAALPLLAPALGALASTPALAQQLDVEAILHDPQAPTSGNPKGDITIVAFLDYNCPYCKKSAPDLERVVKEDGKIRVVYKDWPVITEASVFGAQLALGASYQGKYDAAHKALMAIPGRRVTEDQMRKAIADSGIDLQRLQADLNAHGEEIMALIKRNNAQANSLGLRGTPTYLVGPLLASTLDYDSFKRAIAQARRQQAGGQ